MRKNLILAAVGDESVHPTWLTKDPARSYDLALIYFGKTPDRFAADAEYYVERTGIKFRLIHDLAHRELAATLPRYEYVWLPDDDIAASPQLVNRLFQIAAEFDLAVCQPAIATGDVTYQSLRADPRFLLRYSRFVEMMCPLFSQAALQRALSLFIANQSGWGIDLVWSSWFADHEMAVIDAAPVAHTRPLKTGGVHRRLAELGINPMDELRQLAARHSVGRRRFQRGLRRGTARLEGVLLDGSTSLNRSWWPAWMRRAA
jgi:hypothetical protein